MQYTIWLVNGRRINIAEKQYHILIEELKRQKPAKRIVISRADDEGIFVTTAHITHIEPRDTSDF